MSLSAFLKIYFYFKKYKHLVNCVKVAFQFHHVFNQLNFESEIIYVTFYIQTKILIVDNPTFKTSFSNCINMKKII